MKSEKGSHAYYLVAGTICACILLLFKAYSLAFWTKRSPSMGCLQARLSRNRLCIYHYDGSNPELIQASEDQEMPMSICIIAAHMLICTVSWHSGAEIKNWLGGKGAG